MNEENLFVQEEAPKKQINFATVAEVYNDGLSLIFDGEEEASEKHYQCNAFVVFKKGDRVRIIEDSGSYVVEYPVGNPKRTFVADSATTAKSADRAAKADSATKAGSADTAASATTAGKLSTSRKISLTGAVTGSQNFNGSSDISISTSLSSTATAYNFSNKHTGSYLGFFNGSITTKKSVTAISSASSATISTVVAKVNEIISALKSYNLL